MVLKPAQVNIGAGIAGPENFHEIHGQGFYQELLLDQLVGGILQGGQIANESRVTERLKTSQR